MNKKLIAIDFDETITDNTPYPIMGKVRSEALYYIPKLYDLGYTLILWTCRTGKWLDEAINYLQELNLMQYFEYINDDGLNRDSRKIVADFYIDDKSCMGEINWETVYKYIIKNIPLV